MSRQQEIAIGIALQTHLVAICPVHKQLYSDFDEYEDEDENLARAFALAVELAREHNPFADQGHYVANELTDLLSHTIGAAPLGCPECSSPRQKAHYSQSAQSPP